MSIVKEGVEDVIIVDVTNESGSGDALFGQASKTSR